MHGHGCGERARMRAAMKAAMWQAMRHGGRHGGGGWGGGFGAEFGGRGGGRGRRMFDGGELRLVLLKLIGDESRHGYELIKAVEELSGGAYAPSPGVVYPALSMLAEMGLIAEQASDDSRKRFAITPDGSAHLAENADMIAVLMARIAGVNNERARHGAAPVRRAMGNLKVALGDRMARGDVDEDVLHAIAAVIDEAAQKVERLKSAGGRA